MYSRALSKVVETLPDAYFQKQKDDRKPLAPLWRILTGYTFELSAAAVAFAVMCWYFRTTPTPQITITKTLLPGQICTTLNSKRGTTYYSKVHSENAQFASPSMTKDECQNLLNSQKVCSDGVRYDHLQLWGITNPNMSQYTYSSTGGGFYYSFSPNQDQKFDTMLAPFVGKSVSFPKPDITSSAYTGVGASFTGSTTNWYVYNFAKGTSSDSFSSFAGVPVESFLFDEKQTKMYDPSPQKKGARCA
jgi:hypothetical protein